MIVQCSLLIVKGDNINLPDALRYAVLTCATAALIAPAHPALPCAAVMQSTGHIPTSTDPYRHTLAIASVASANSAVHAADMSRSACRVG